jgi:predicted MPP superfamily phosphohydrolase
MVGHNQVTLKFRTDVSSSAKVLIQTKNGKSRLIRHSASTTNHSFLLDSLLPNTKYFYQIGFQNGEFIADSTQFFFTAPLPNSTEKIRFGVIADMFPGATQEKVFRTFRKIKGEKDFQFLLTLGDNVYVGANDKDYQLNFFDVYAKGNFLKQVPLFTALGNHDYDGVSNRVHDSPAVTYFSAFSLPTKAELGGIPSGSEAYYSFDYGNIHLISVDTEGFGKDGLRLIDDNSLQRKWLLEDLAKTKSTWKILFFHHPPFTKGTYDSDAVSLLSLIRQKLVPIFEKYKVDLVLNGHSHVYERSKPITNFTGSSDDFDPLIHWSQSSSGKYDGGKNACPYFFSSSDSSKNGVIYVVNGVAGATGKRRANAPHRAMEFMVDQVGGFMNFEVQGNRLDALFYDEDGQNLDRFTVFKDLPRKSTETKTLNYLDKLSIEAPWQGDFVWSTGDKTAKIVVSPKESSTFTVRDVQNCLSHQVQVNVVFPDTDGDGLRDDLDKCPNTIKGQKVDAQGCADAQKDTDGDGITDDLDKCPNTKKGQKVDAQGCADSQKDTDGDGITDDLDKCPNTVKGQKVDAQGCADAQKDTDGDGITDDLDKCPNTVKGQKVDAQGCADAQKDTDGDGITDDLDKCPNTVKGQKVDAQGCADAQKDTDGDGITDDKDDCPTIVNPKAPVITQTNEINLTISGGAVYQWFLNGIALTNSNSGNIQAIETGNYSVQFKTDKGCISPISKSVMVLITEISEANTPKIFPNPVKESLQIEFPKVFGQTVQLSIFDIKGQLIWHKDHLANKSLLDLHFLPSGTFFLQLRSNENERLYTQKLLKE